MESRHLRIFQREIERQCTFAIIAYNDLTQALNGRSIDRVWYSIQSFLVASGNISKLLWQSIPRIERLKGESDNDFTKRREIRERVTNERGKELRTSLFVDDKSPLETRTFRNHFEHFDVRLEDWIISSERHNFADSNIGQPNMIAGIDPNDYLRNLNTTNMAITFRGDSYQLIPIIKEIRNLRDRAVVESEKLI